MNKEFIESVVEDIDFMRLGLNEDLDILESILLEIEETRNLSPEDDKLKDLECDLDYMCTQLKNMLDRMENLNG